MPATSSCASATTSSRTSQTCSRGSSGSWRIPSSPWSCTRSGRRLQVPPSPGPAPRWAPWGQRSSGWGPGASLGVGSGPAGLSQVLVFLSPEISSKPQRVERYKELIHRLPRLNHKTLAALIGHLYRSVGPFLRVQPALWGLPAAQGMLAPIPKRQGGPHAHALLHPRSCCWNTSGIP